MRQGKRLVIITIIYLLSTVWQTTSAQTYPILPTDPAVTQGTLPNGITYYIVANPSVKGLADIALVQKAGGNDASLFARECLDSVPLFKSRRPVDFLFDKGVRQHRSGFVKVTDDATVYRFRNLPLTGSSSAVDSVLLLAFDLAKIGTERDSALYSTEGQAIIIAGNVDAGALTPKLQMLSLMIPATGAVAEKERTAAIKEKSVLSDQLMPDGINSITVSFQSGKMPPKYIKTVLPLMSKHLWNLSSKIISDRLEKELMTAGIPVGKILFTSTGEGRYTGSDSYEISLTVNSSDSEKTKEILLAVLNDLADGGLSHDEFKAAERKVTIDMKRRESYSFLSNEILTEKCISAFLYGTSIVSSKDETAYLLSSDVPDSVWINLINGFLKGLINDLPERETEYVLCGKPYTADSRDTVLFPSSAVKAKISKTRSFNVSGGPVWTFDNGMNVYYKELPTGGDFYYDLTIRSGFGEVTDLHNGEGAFLSDLFFTGSVCGIDGRSFKSILEVNGISMNIDVGLSRTRISGQVRSSSLELLMKALLAVINGYEADPDAARYHLECERIRLAERKGSFSDRMASVDSIICSGYKFSSIKNHYGLEHDDLPDHAADFYNSLFSKSEDGGLTLVGSMEEFKLKKILCKYIGGFRTTNMPRLSPSIRFQPSSGWSTYTTKGLSTTVDVVTSSSLPLTGENYMAAKIASWFVYDALADELANYGLYYFTRESFSFTPEERFSLSISVERADTTGLQASIKKNSFLQTLYSIRSVISSLDGMDIDQEKLDMYKTRLKNTYDSEQAKPQYWLNVISDRISYGKTYNRFYGDAINSVTADSVKKVLKAMNQGTRVEYIVKRHETSDTDTD